MFNLGHCTYDGMCMMEKFEGAVSCLMKYGACEKILHGSKD